MALDLKFDTKNEHFADREPRRAARWVAKLQGKKVIGLATDTPPATDGE